MAMGENGSITPAYNVLNEKKSDQTVVPICESPYGLKKTFNVLRNTHLNYRRSCANILLDERFCKNKYAIYSS